MAMALQRFIQESIQESTKCVFVVGFGFRGMCPEKWPHNLLHIVEEYIAFRD
jgi:hypothetical protein